jgi:hypothetical protein
LPFDGKFSKPDKMNDDFLNDLDELGEDLEEEVDNNGIAKEEGDVDEDEDLDLEDMLDTMAKQPGVSSVSTLRTSARFQDHMKVPKCMFWIITSYLSV